MMKMGWRGSLASAWVVLALAGQIHGAGVTIITHGLNGNVDDWVIAMADRMTQYYRFPGTNFTCYEIYFTVVNSTYVPTWRRLGGSTPAGTDSGEILIKLDWRQLANDSYSTYAVASAIAPVLLQPNFVAEMNGRAIAELPLHLIGHSRGGSLVCELSRLLGASGVWVDHLTTLDPHPLNNDGFSDFPYTEVDAPARTYLNVLFHDNYFQTLNFLFYGEAVAGAYVRQLTDLDGGYGGVAASHSDVHLWYHGTVDLRLPADDTVATIGSAERQTWWLPYENYGVTAGFYYSLIGGGDRLSADQPAGTGTGQIRDGYNQIWDFGAGVSGNRYLLPSNSGTWPNIIKFNIVGSNTVTSGTSVSNKYFFQFGQSATPTATVQIFLDADANPYNGNSGQVFQITESGTGTNFMRTRSLSFSPTNSPGDYYVFARVTDGTHTRYLYAPEILTITPAPATMIAPTLVSAGQGTNIVLRWPTNALGFTLQWATNLPSTNWATASPSPSNVNGQYTVTNGISGRSRFYRLRKP